MHIITGYDILCFFYRCNHITNLVFWDFLRIKIKMNKDGTSCELAKALRNSESSLPLENDSALLNKYIHAATSDNTRRAYQSAIRQFEKWGGRLPTNAERIVDYLLNKASVLNVRTIELHITAISQWHHYQGIKDPTRAPLVRKTIEGIKRTHGKPKRKAKALKLEHIASMLNYLRKLPESNKKYRDIALVLIGFFGAFRRSELVNIQIEDLEWDEDGLIIQIDRSKTDQQGHGLKRAIPFGDKYCCAATAVKDWLNHSKIDTGALFRPINRWGQIQNRQLNPSSINELLKGLGQICKFNFVPELSSHSFRRGLSTSAARERIDFELIKKQGGWKNDATVWGYIEEGQQLTENASLQLMEKLASLANPKK